MHDRDVNAARNLRDEGMRLYWLVALGAAARAGVPPPVIKASELEVVSAGRVAARYECYGPTGRRPKCLWSPCKTGRV